MPGNDDPLHHRTELQLAVEPQPLFAHLDDHRRLAAHMETRSLMTAGGSMRIELDDGNGRAVGLVICMKASVLGLRLRSLVHPTDGERCKDRVRPARKRPAQRMTSQTPR